MAFRLCVSHRALFLLLFLVHLGSSNLSVNIKSKKGDIIRQIFKSDPEGDVVTVNYKLNEGQFIDMLVDFRKKHQIFKAIILGEIEKVESPYEAMCFVRKFGDREFISSDAMSKLRQKNPSAIRSPEEDLGTEKLVMDHEVTMEKAALLDHHVQHMCKDAGKINLRGEDLKQLLAANSTEGDLDVLHSLSHNLSESMQWLKKCHDLGDASSPCICQLQLCLSWYPCDLKYCSGPDTEEYRCGIKTCGKCYDFHYQVEEDRHCFWNGDDDQSQTKSIGQPTILRINDLTTHSSNMEFLSLLSLAVQKTNRLSQS